MINEKNKEEKEKDFVWWKYVERCCFEIPEEFKWREKTVRFGLEKWE